MLSFYEYKLNKKRTYLNEDDSDSVFTAPDKTKVLPILSQAISQIEPMISNLTELSKKMDGAGINGSKIKKTAESLEAYIETLKKAQKDNTGA